MSMNSESNASLSEEQKYKKVTILLLYQLNLKTGDTVAPELAAVAEVRWCLREILVLLPADILVLAGEAGNLHLKPNTNGRKRKTHT